MNSVNTLPGSLAKIQSTVQSPHNIEAEQQLLGAILLNNEVFDRVSSIINSDHFFEPVHKRIFETSASRIGKNLLVSPVTLKTYFEDDEGLQELGGPAYLVKLQGSSLQDQDLWLRLRQQWRR